MLSRCFFNLGRAHANFKYQMSQSNNIWLLDEEQVIQHSSRLGGFGNQHSSRLDHVQHYHFPFVLSLNWFLCFIFIMDFDLCGSVLAAAADAPAPRRAGDGSHTHTHTHYLLPILSNRLRPTPFQSISEIKTSQSWQLGVSSWATCDNWHAS